MNFVHGSQVHRAMLGMLPILKCLENYTKPGFMPPGSLHQSLQNRKLREACPSRVLKLPKLNMETQWVVRKLEDCRALLDLDKERGWLLDPRDLSSQLTNRMLGSREHQTIRSLSSSPRCATNKSPWGVRHMYFSTTLTQTWLFFHTCSLVNHHLCRIFWYFGQWTFCNTE